jgi:hypothetical protein
MIIRVTGSGVGPFNLILLKNLPFILREPQDERRLESAQFAHDR